MEAAAEVSTITCTNCKRTIEESKYQLHEAFCRRNLKLCRICNEPILIRQLEEHIKECDTEAPCEICNKAVKAGQKDSHLETCAAKVSCAECREEHSRGRMEQHVVEKHSKIPCELCSAIVPSSRVKEHVNVCHTCPHCSTIIGPVHELQQHVENFCTAVKKECKYCKLEFNNSQYHSHMEACGSRTEVCEVCSKRITLREMDTHKCVPKTASEKAAEHNKKISCDLCSAQVLSTKMEDHIRLCHTCEYCNTIIPSYDLKDHVENFCPGGIKKCDYCQLSFSHMEYPSHVEMCRPQIQTCESCSQQVMLCDMEQHMKECVQQKTSHENRRRRKCVCM